MRQTTTFMREISSGFSAMRAASTFVAALGLSVMALPAQATVIPLDGGQAALAQGSPINTTTSQALIGSGAWQANGSAKSSYFFDISPLGNARISDLTKLGFSTYKSTTGGSAPDWYLTIYTAPDGVNDDAGWYGRRLTFEGLYANNFSNPADTWNTWSTDAGTNQLTFYDGNRGGNFGFYGGPTLDELVAGPIDWGSYATSGTGDVVDYRDEDILYIVLETGSGWAAGYEGRVDAVMIGAGDRTLTFDLEATAAIPEPGTLALLGLGLLGLGVMRRRVTRNRGDQKLGE